MAQGEGALVSRSVMNAGADGSMRLRYNYDRQQGQLRLCRFSFFYSPTLLALERGTEFHVAGPPLSTSILAAGITYSRQFPGTGSYSPPALPSLALGLGPQPHPGPQHSRWPLLLLSGQRLEQL